MADTPSFVKPYIGRRVTVYLCSGHTGGNCPEPESHAEHQVTGLLLSVNEYGEGKLRLASGRNHWVWPVLRVEDATWEPLCTCPVDPDDASNGPAEAFTLSTCPVHGWTGR